VVSLFKDSLVFIRTRGDDLLPEDFDNLGVVMTRHFKYGQLTLEEIKLLGKVEVKLKLFLNN